MTDTLHTDERAAVTQAAAAFESIWRSPASCDPDASLACLSAAEQLTLAGADPAPARPRTVHAGDVAPLLRQALLTLSSLPAAVFAHPPILAASYCGQAALRLL